MSSFNRYQNKMNTIQAHQQASRDVIAADQAFIDGMLKKIAAYGPWAESTKLGDAVSPVISAIVGKDIKFSDLFLMGMTKSGNFPALYVFPWLNSDDTRASLAVAPNGTVNALVHAFGTQRYGGGLEKFDHIRLFDPRINELNARVAFPMDVKTWFKYQWIAGENRFRWTKMNPASDAAKGMVAKHRSIMEMLTALENGRSFEIPLYNKITLDRVNRNVIDRLNLTVAEAVKQCGDDWEGAQAQAAANQALETAGLEQTRKGTVAPVAPGSLVVDNVDLTTLTERKIFVITDKYGEKDVPLNPAYPDAFKRNLAQIQEGLKSGSISKIVTKTSK